MLLTLLIASLVLSVALPFGMFMFGQKTKKRFTTALLVNCVSFFGTLFVATVFMFNGVAIAGEVATTASAAASSNAGMAYLAAALATAVGSIGAGMAVGQAASSAIGAISENPSIFGKTLVFVGLAEGIAIYGLLISLMILFRV